MMDRLQGTGGVGVIEYLVEDQAYTYIGMQGRDNSTAILSMTKLLGRIYVSE